MELLTTLEMKQIKGVSSSSAHAPGILIKLGRKLTFVFKNKRKLYLQVLLE